MMSEVYDNHMVLQNVFGEDQELFSYGHGMIPISNQASYSPYSGSSTSQGTSVSSPMSTSLSPLHGTDYTTLNTVTAIGEPYLTINEQPTEKFRFRYKSEMIGTHGSLVGASSGGSRKKHAPTVQLHNFSDKAIIRCTLVTSDEGHRLPHAHRLVRREGNTDCDDPHDIEISPENGFIASFYGMGIIHTAKKHIRDELVRKMKIEALEKIKRRNINESLSMREEAQIKADADYYQKHLNLNSVALCFQAFILDQNSVAIPITEPVYSHAINNLKSALTGELKICRIDKHTSSCEGGEEVFIFVERVGKKNIKIKFFEVDDDDREIWSAYGRFSELDVHHQYAIVFRTPPYKDINITSPKEVFMQLERPSDLECSEPIKFTYKPSDRVMGRKRQRMSYSSSIELSNILPTYNTPPVEELLTSNQSRELSKEIHKILSERCPSSELKNFVAQMDLDEYAELFGSSEENMLTSDGPSSKQQHQDDITFAKSVLIEAMKCIKMNPASGKESLLRLLKERTTYGDSALHSALRYGQRDIVKYILMLISTDKDCTALVNGQNSSGKTPLHYAVLQNQPEITKVLLMLGADPNRCDDHGCSPLHAAVKIPEAGACVDALISEKMTNLEAYNDAGWTPLQLAAEAGSYHAVRSLVQAGVNVNNTDMSYGRTALHIAVEGGHKNIVEFLLTETKIDVNKKNFSGNTALHSAVVYTGERAKELCALLIRYGADPRIQNHNRECGIMDKGMEEQVNVKVENNSDDTAEEATLGQSSFDLASNKPDILQLFTNQREEPQNTISTIVPKEEVESETEAEAETDRGPQKEWLNNKQKQKLSEILDRSKGWEKLASHLNFECLLRTLQQSTSPSIVLLNYMDILGTISLPEMKTILADLGEEDAADYVMEIINTKC